MSNFTFLRREDGMPQILQHRPERFAGFLDLTQAILRGPSTLSVAERELLFAYVSALNSCSFCFGAHKAIASAFDIDEKLLDELATADEPSAAGERLLPCLRLAKKSAQSAHRVTRADVEEMIEAGWGEEAAHEVISIAALATFSNILVSAHGVTGTPADFAHAAEVLGPGGSYKP